MSETVNRLQRARDLSNTELQPAFDWAIHEAIEAEYRAAYTSDQAMCGVDPVYPTIVRLLAASLPVIADAIEDGVK